MNDERAIADEETKWKAYTRALLRSLSARADLAIALNAWERSAIISASHLRGAGKPITRE